MPCPCTRGEVTSLSLHQRRDENRDGAHSPEDPQETWHGRRVQSSGRPGCVLSSHVTLRSPWVCDPRPQKGECRAFMRRLVSSRGWVVWCCPLHPAQAAPMGTEGSPRGQQHQTPRPQGQVGQTPRATLGPPCWRDGSAVLGKPTHQDLPECSKQALSTSCPLADSFWWGSTERGLPLWGCPAQPSWLLPGTPRLHMWWWVGMVGQGLWVPLPPAPGRHGAGHARPPAGGR